jgi:hypothetical protein
MLQPPEFAPPFAPPFPPPFALAGATANARAPAVSTMSAANMPAIVISFFIVLLRSR